MAQNRRQFLYGSTQAGLLASLPGLALFANHSATHAQSAEDYKALVCIYLFGGNDGHNMLVPMGANYASYAALRPINTGAATDLNIGHAENALLPLAGDSASSYGLHPQLVNLASATYWNASDPAAGTLAVVKNLGTLVQPVTSSTLYSAGVIRPQGLLSHSDQQICSMIALRGTNSFGAENGWGARVLQPLMTSFGSADPDLAMVSFAGNQRWLLSRYLKTTTLNANVAVPATQGALLNPLYLRGLHSPDPFVRTYAQTMNDAYAKASKVNSVVADTSSTVETTFRSVARQPPNTPMSSQFYSQCLAVGKFIAQRSLLNSPKRQIFMISLGGFDTHAGQYRSQNALMTQLNTGMHALYQALQSIGMHDKVTLFTMSDFGRTLRMNSSNGTDHAWASHHMVLGGAVKGGFYGKEADFQATATTLTGPDLVPDNKNVVIPSTSIDQYAATLSRWFGVPDESLPIVFPNLKNFGTSVSNWNVGFMR